MTTFDAAVLVGGASRRMGRDKALVEVDGTPMAVRVAAALDTAGARDLVLVGGVDRGLDRRHVPDLHPGEGPLGGVLSALSALEAELIVVVACDLPWMDAAVVQAVLDGLGDADVAFARTDRREPLCAVWRRTAAAPALTRSFASGERAIHRAVGDLRVVEVEVDASALTNVNTPEDLGRGPHA